MCFRREELPENSSLAGGAVAVDSGRLQQVASAQPDLPSAASSLKSSDFKPAADSSGVLREEKSSGLAQPAACERE